MIDFRLARFAFVGLANTVLGLALIYAGKAFLGFSDAAANFAGYAIALLMGFSLNRRWTFEYTGSGPGTFLRYLLVLAVAYAANLATVMAAIELMGMDGYVAQALGILPYALTSYLGLREFAFHTNPLP